MSDYDAYRKLYGDLVDLVPHYQTKCEWTWSGSEGCTVYITRAGETTII